MMEWGDGVRHISLQVVSEINTRHSEILFRQDTDAWTSKAWHGRGRSIHAHSLPFPHTHSPQSCPPPLSIILVLILPFCVPSLSTSLCPRSFRRKTRVKPYSRESMWRYVTTS